MEEMKTQTIGGKTFEIVDAKAREDLANLRKEGLGGEPGATFTPAVSEDGTLSWTNDRELANPAPVNIMGPQGGPGPVGPAPVKGVDYWTPEDQAAIEDYVDNAMAERAGLMVNFSVKAYASEDELLAATPASNTIGVVTETEISKSVLSPTAPANPVEGMVWVSTSDTGGNVINTLSAAGVEFGAVCPVNARQYVNGAWEGKTAKNYRGGAWINWIVYLYKRGQIGIGGAPAQIVNQTGADVVTLNDNHILINLNGTITNRAGFPVAVDFANYTTMTATVKVPSKWSYAVQFRFGVDSEQHTAAAYSAATINGYVANTEYTITLDVSAYNEKSKPWFELYNGTGKGEVKTLYVLEINLE